MQNLKVIFEDNHIIVVEKPVNIPSQADKTGDIDMLTIIKAYLKEKYKTIEYLIGHYEYTLFEDHTLWLEKDKTYRTTKTDPGLEFMTSIRNKTKKYRYFINNDCILFSIKYNCFIIE